VQGTTSSIIISILSDTMPNLQSPALPCSSVQLVWNLQVRCLSL